MGSAAAKMFKPRAVLYLLAIMLDCLVQTTESKTETDDQNYFEINKTNQTTESETEPDDEISKPGLCTTCWYYWWFYCTLSDLERCRQQVCPRCRYDDNCTPEWCLPLSTTSTTTKASTTTTTDPTNGGDPVTNDTITDILDITPFYNYTDKEATEAQYYVFELQN